MTYKRLFLDLAIYMKAVNISDPQNVKGWALKMLDATGKSMELLIILFRNCLITKIQELGFALSSFGRPV